MRLITDLVKQIEKEYGYKAFKKLVNFIDLNRPATIKVTVNN